MSLPVLTSRNDKPAELLISGARVFDPREEIDATRDVLVREGEIAEIAEAGTIDAPDGCEAVDGEGSILVPGFFDPHVHLRTPGRENAEDIQTGTRSAAAGGFTGIVAMANTEPPVDTPAAISALRERAAAEACVPTGFVATVTRGMAGEELTDMVEISEAGAIGFSDDGLPIRSARIMRRALQYQQICGGNILLHEEDPELSGAGVMNEGEVSAALGLEGIPGTSESTMIARDALLCLTEGGRAHVQHLSSADSVRVLAEAKAAGSPITGEATPHHLIFTDEEVRSLDPARFKMNPSLRTEEDRQALIEGLRSGVIDCIGTDHAPHASEFKEVPYEVAAMGVTGLETAFAALYTELVEPGVIDLALLVRRLGDGASLFDLEPARIAPGREANLALIDPEAEWIAGERGWESKSSNNSFTGRRLRSRVQLTVAGGAIAYRQRSFAMGVAK